MKHLVFGALIAWCALTAKSQTPATLVQTDLPPIWREAGAQKRILAGQAAKTTGMRSLIERVYGLPITSSTTVYDLVRVNSEARTSVEQTLQGMTELTSPKYFEDGRLEMDLAIAIASVKKILHQEVEKKKIAGVTITEKEWSAFEYRTEPKIVVETATGALEGSVGEQRITARRAAELDAYTKLAQRMLGVSIASETTVKDAVLASDYVRSHVAGFLRGAKKTSVVYDLADNSCKVGMQIDMVNVFEVIKTYAATNDGKVKKQRIEISERTEPMTFSEVGEAAPKPKDLQRDLLNAQNPGSAAAEPFKETYTIIERLVGQRLIP